MTTKDWLSRANGLEAEIKEMQEIYQKALETACNTVSVPKEVSVQESNKNSTERKLVAVAVYSDMISKKISERYRIMEEITGAIESVPDTRLKTLLYARYINNKKWEQIALILHYDYYHVVKYLHPKALSFVKLPK